ncbi:hypothetical protein [Daejeonella sp.]|uniref:hypothetical protein n=1 Tax=Daejeonella sp. TaxID=2805397 RepID=UPI0039835F8C
MVLYGYGYTVYHSTRASATVYPQIIIPSISWRATDPEGGHMFIDNDLGIDWSTPEGGRMC